MKKTIAAILLSAVLLAGCYGPFKLTQRVYEWNGSIETKWGQEALFLVLNIIPVYGFAALADAVFFNLIDFWEGDNPLAQGGRNGSTIVARDGKQVVVTVSRGEKKLRMDLFSNYRPRDFVTIEQLADGRSGAKNARGEIVMTARTRGDGSVVIEDAEGKPVAMHPAR